MNMPMPNDLYYKVLDHFQTILAPGTLHSHLAMPPLPLVSRFYHRRHSSTTSSLTKINSQPLAALRLMQTLWSLSGSMDNYKSASSWTFSSSNKQLSGCINWAMCIGLCQLGLILSIQFGTSSEFVLCFTFVN